MIIILYLSQIAQRCCQVRNGRPYDRPCGARFQRPTRTRVSTAPKTSCNSLAFRRVSSEGHVNISTEGQPGSDLSAERQPVSDWSKWLHVTIMWLLWTSDRFYTCLYLFGRFAISLSPPPPHPPPKKACLKPRTVIIHTKGVHNVEREHEITEKT